MRKCLILLCLLFVLFVISFHGLAEDLPEIYVSFEFNEVSPGYALNAMCKSNGINLVYLADKNNPENLSIKLDKVIFSEALNMIMLKTDLDYYFDNNVLIVDTKENIKNNYDKSINTVQSNSSIIIDNSNNEVASLIIDQDIVEEEDENINPGYVIREGIKQGTLIPARLEVGLVSSSKELPALVRVTHNISYKGNILIPKGSLFYGYGVTDFNARKIFVRLDKLILGDREIDVTAHLIKGNGESGFCSEYRDLEMEKFWPTFLMNFAGMISDAFKDKYYVEDEQGKKHPVEDDSLKNNMIDKSKEGVQSWSNQLMNDAEENKAIITVEAGLDGFVFIDEKITLDKFKTDK
ncbi:MAG: TrbI/VirB10 family protein [bacterium]